MVVMPISPIALALRPDAAVAIEQPGVKLALGRYIKIIRDQLPAKFMISKRLAVNFNPASSEDVLWRAHAAAMRKFRALERQIDAGKAKLEDIKTPRQSLLDLKIALADKIMASCRFCIRRCRVNRLRGELGFCRAGTEWRIFGAHAHYGEEAELVPSGTIFQAACGMRCIYCQNAPESQNPELGQTWAIQDVAKWAVQARKEGCRNINWVGGSPDQWTWQILHALKLIDVNVPQVWNSCSYYSSETARLIDGLMDVYLLDFRYMSEGCAIRLSQAPGYPKAAMANHLAAAKAGELLVRLLVLPGHLECDAKPIVKWIRQKLGPDTRFNILPQYWPAAQAHKFPEISRRLRREEWQDVVKYAKKLGLRNLVRA
jgi:putative pyruvate formate lyase activating enzyme